MIFFSFSSQFDELFSKIVNFDTFITKGTLAEQKVLTNLFFISFSFPTFSLSFKIFVSFFIILFTNIAMISKVLDFFLELEIECSKGKVGFLTILW